MNLSQIYSALHLEGELRKGVVWMIGGTAIGQLLTLAITPVLSRLFTPSDFGLLAIFNSVVGVFAVAITLRFELVIPLVRKHATALNTLLIATGSAILLSSLVGIVLYVFSDQLGRLLKVANFSKIIPWIVLGLLLTGVYQALLYWSTRNRRFGLVATSKLLQSSGQGCVQVLGGVFHLGGLMLVIGRIAGVAAAIGSLLKIRDYEQSHIKMGVWLPIILRYKDFPLYNAWGAILTVIGTQAISLLIAGYFNLRITGLFAFTVMILSAPAALISQAVGQVIYPILAESSIGKQKQAELVAKLFALLSVLSFPLFLCFVLNGRFIFQLVFGDKWADAGYYAEVIAPSLALSFISSPLSLFMFVKNKQRLASFIAVYETTLRIGAIVIGGYIGSPVLAIALYSISGVVSGLIYIIYILYIAEICARRLLNRLLPFILQLAVITGVLILTKYVLPPSYELIVSTTVLAALSLLWVYKDIRNAS